MNGDPKISLCSIPSCSWLGSWKSRVILMCTVQVEYKLCSHLQCSHGSCILTRDPSSMQLDIVIDSTCGLNNEKTQEPRMKMWKEFYQVLCSGLRRIFYRMLPLWRALFFFSFLPIFPLSSHSFPLCLPPLLLSFPFGRGLTVFTAYPLKART